jgi:hypothetical protein
MFSSRNLIRTKCFRTFVTRYTCTTCVLSLSLMLRPTVRRPVYLGIKHPSGSYDQIFITVRYMRVCWCGALSLTKGRICRLQFLLALVSAVILGFESPGIHGHILLSQIRDFFFVASYDSQGYGGVICKLPTFIKLYIADFLLNVIFKIWGSFYTMDRANPNKGVLTATCFQAEHSRQRLPQLFASWHWEILECGYPSEQCRMRDPRVPQRPTA